MESTNTSIFNLFLCLSPDTIKKTHGGGVLLLVQLQQPLNRHSLGGATRLPSSLNCRSRLFKRLRGPRSRNATRCATRQVRTTGWRCATWDGEPRPTWALKNRASVWANPRRPHECFPSYLMSIIGEVVWKNHVRYRHF